MAATFYVILLAGLAIAQVSAKCDDQEVPCKPICHLRSYPDEPSLPTALDVTDLPEKVYRCLNRYLENRGSEISSVVCVTYQNGLDETYEVEYKSGGKWKKPRNKVIAVIKTSRGRIRITGKYTPYGYSQRQV